MNLLDREGNPRYTSLHRDEITSRSIVRGSDGEISNNVQSFNFSVGAYQEWKPLLSEWVLRAKISQVGGAQLAAAANIAPGLNMALDGWQYIHFFAGTQKIDEVSEHVGETSMIRTRLEKSKSWFDCVGKTQMTDSSFKLRQNYIISDAPALDDNIAALQQVDISTIANATINVGANWTIANGAAGQSTITLAGATLQANNHELQVGDVLRFQNATHGNAGANVSIVAFSAATTMEVSPRIAANNATAYVAGDVLVDRVSETPAILADLSVAPVYNGRDELEIQFKLPLGVSYLDSMPPGDYEYRLRGFSKAEFSKRLIESIGADKVEGVDFEINIIDFYYYPYIVETGQRLDDGIITKTFKCYESQKKKILSTNNQLQFTIKGNSSALGFAIQDGRIGNDSRYSPARFKAFKDAGINDGSLTDANRVDNKVSYYQIRYDGKYRPEPAQQDDLFNPRSNRIVQSYIDTYKNAGPYYYEGGMETLDDFIDRGPLYFWQFPRDKNSYATEARIDLRFNEDPETNAFCLFFFCFYRTIRMTIQDGKIVSVVKNI